MSLFLSHFVTPGLGWDGHAVQVQVLKQSFVSRVTPICAYSKCTIRV